jgi:hypothetical protein
MKKFVLVSIAIVVIVGTTILFWHRSGHPTDAQISHDITGFWPSDKSGSGEQLNPNGSFLVIAHDSGGTNLYAGTWVINNGYLSETLTNVSGPSPHGRAGDKAPPQKIISVDAHHMTVEAGGQTHTMSR